MFTKGVGVHKDYLTSFELALRSWRFPLIWRQCWVFSSSCKRVSRGRSQAFTSWRIVHCVMARQATSEPNRLISASIGLALPADANQYGYLSEHHPFGETEKKAEIMQKILQLLCLRRPWHRS